MTDYPKTGGEFLLCIERARRLSHWTVHTEPAGADDDHARLRIVFRPSWVHGPSDLCTVTAEHGQLFVNVRPGYSLRLDGLSMFDGHTFAEHVGRKTWCRDSHLSFIEELQRVLPDAPLCNQKRPRAVSGSPAPGLPSERRAAESVTEDDQK